MDIHGAGQGSAPIVPAAIEPRALRGVLGRWSTGVAIVTCADAGGAPVGLTANSFSALSLEPPLVLWSLRQVSPSLAAFRTASHFAVNVLAENQVDLARLFASPTPDRFSQGLWSPGLGGAPLLAGCAAVLECSAESAQGAGDHTLFIGRVQRLGDSAIAPLLFQAGHYRMLGEIL
jgi:flavin reductase (DIM6/NTAB) family NADH-FMN oxidoreductase RutF